MLWLTCLWFIAVLVCLLALWRSYRVSKFELRMIDRIYERGLKDIYEGSPDLDHANWRCAEFEEVSHTKMVVQFWRRFESFFPKDPARKVR